MRMHKKSTALSAGDTVVRTHGSFRGMKVGDYSIIKEVHSYGVELEGYGGYHGPQNFKKVINDVQGF